ncbi:MAG: polysaccharide deacetylase family protein [Chitinophagales bacterium]
MKMILLFFSLFILYPVIDKKNPPAQNNSPKKSVAKKIEEINKQVPVLCYHNIKKNPKREDFLTISEAHLDAQLKLLYDSGYHSILPDQLYKYLTLAAGLPSKPILLSFDDTHEEDFSIAKTILEKYGFKAVFFIMTVCIDKSNYLTSAQIKELSDDGHTIGNHTRNHPKITTLTGKDWEEQIGKPGSKLEKLTGKPVNFFAYPYGVWNEVSIHELKKRNLKAAFQLSGKTSANEPLFTIRRIMVSGLWSPFELKRQMEKAFR